MDGRTRSRPRGRGIVVPVALAIALMLGSGGSHAGILRNVMSSLGLTSQPASKSGAAPVFPRHGYSCCVLHYDDDWISDGNYASLPLIPAGTPVDVLSYGRNRAEVKVDGKPMRLGHDLGRDQESLDDWVNKIVISEDPRPRFARYPAVIQQAIREGKVMVGMTRDQAVAAVGYPTTNETFSLDTPVWRLMTAKREEYQLNFGADGRVASIFGEDAITSQVTYRPGK